MTKSTPRHFALMATYTATIFLSATLLFLVQPMFARMVLPLLGGTPAVWNTCMVFFQATLLLGYLYAHLTTRWLSPKRQACLHLTVMLLPLVLLPIAVPTGWQLDADGNPIVWLLALLCVSVGLPFFVVSTSNPLLQKWFSATGHPAGDDPYFLYAASNSGSLLALVSYPLLMEPALRLADQGWTWSAGYGLLALCTATCAVLLWRSNGTESEGANSQRKAHDESTNEEHGLTLKRRMKWVLWAFIPSSLMLGVTAHVATDMASFPLLWIIPLILYLLTFILVFAKRQILPVPVCARVLPWVALPLAISIHAVPTQGALWILIAMNLFAFFMASMVCHGQLAQDRPTTKDLTEFYLWMSVGGVLGGLFNALAAPMLFERVYEYSIAIVLACLVIPVRGVIRNDTEARVLDVALPAGLVAAVACLAWMLGTVTDSLATLLLAGIPAIISFTFVERPLRFGLGIAATLLGGFFFEAFHGHELYAERSFFGVNRVITDTENNLRVFVHGTTIHGWQSLDDDRKGEPMAYYHRRGPVGSLFDQYNDGELNRVGVIGLGCGIMMAYHEPGRHFTFYEIDPAVKRIAENPRLFTYLKGFGKSDYEIVLGDGRSRIQDADDGQFDIILLDAFSSDAIPVHLVTREAFQIYFSKLSKHGVLSLNISNRFMNLEPQIAAIAADAGLVCLSCPDVDVETDGDGLEMAGCHFLMVARSVEDLRGMIDDSRWQLITEQHSMRPWTDDYSNVLEVLNW